MTGTWLVEVSKELPQKVASAMAELSETLIGAEYEPIVYLGSQVVNGTNHAVLAKQTILTGRDSTNVVLLIFNEKPGDMKLTLVSIDRVLCSGKPLGGLKVEVIKELDDELLDIFHKGLEGYVGARYTPIVFLGSQVSKGVDYIYVVHLSAMGPNDRDEVALVAINPVVKSVRFADILEDRSNSALGYAFSW